MQLSNTFTIDRPVAEVYQAFLEVEGIATCMPGSTLLGQPEPGTYQGEVKVKVGPLSVNYAGQFVVLDTDDAAHRLTMRAKGREKRGAGNADARIVATLSEAAGGTQVLIETDLDIRGKVAQFGRGVIGEVTDQIMQQFARNVEAKLTESGGVPTAEAAPAGAGTAAATAGRGEAASEPAASSAQPAGAPASAPAAAGGELDAWQLIVKPMLGRHGGSIATVVCAGLAAWLGARAGCRPRHRPYY